jgi:hypothetical protein
MPILQSEPDLYPDNLFTGEVEGRSWWAVYTLARREKELMRRLRAMKIAHYGPIIPCSYRAPNGRRRISHLPLFSNYVFLCGDEHDRRQALTTNCVSRVIVVNEPQRLCTDLKNLWSLIQLGTPLAPEARIEAGHRVIVKNGLFAGHTGIVIRRQGRTRLLVTVDFLQQGASADLDDCDVERID